MVEITAAKQSDLAEGHDRSDEKYVGPILSSSADLADPTNLVPRVESTSATEVLPNCEINCDPSSTNQLEADVALRYAQKLHEALGRRDNLGNPNPDAARVRELLSASSGHGNQISAVYKTLPGERSLLDELHTLPVQDRLKAVETLRSREGRSNDAVNFMSSLYAISHDRDAAERHIVETLAGRDSSSMANFEKDFKTRYGTTVDEALRDIGVSPEAMRAIETLRKPESHRTAEDLQHLAGYAVNSKNLDLLTKALGGFSPQAFEARAALRENTEFISRVTDAFRDSKSNAGALIKLALYAIPVGAAFRGMDLLQSISASRNDTRLSSALDIVSDGGPSLPRIIRDNTASVLGFNNVENIYNAVDRATFHQRRDFVRGHDLVRENREPSNYNERAGLDFYQRTMKSIEALGNSRLQAELEQRLLRHADVVRRLDRRNQSN